MAAEGPPVAFAPEPSGYDTEHDLESPALIPEGVVTAVDDHRFTLCSFTPSSGAYAEQNISFIFIGLLEGDSSKVVVAVPKKVWAFMLGNRPNKVL